MTTVAALCCLTLLVFELSELTHFMDGSLGLDPKMKKPRSDGHVAHSPWHCTLIFDVQVTVPRDKFL